MNKRRSHTGLAAAPAAAVLGVVASLGAAPAIASAHTQRDDSDALANHGANHDEQAAPVKARQSDSDVRESERHNKATSRGDSDAYAAGSADGKARTGTEVSVGGSHRASAVSGTEDTDHAEGSNVRKSSEETADGASHVVTGDTETNPKPCPDTAGGDQNSNLTEEELAYAGPHMHVLSKGHAGSRTDEHANEHTNGQADAEGEQSESGAYAYGNSTAHASAGAGDHVSGHPAAQDERPETDNENAYGHGDAKGDARTHATGHANGHVNARGDKSESGDVKAYGRSHSNEQPHGDVNEHAGGHAGGENEQGEGGAESAFGHGHAQGQANAHTTSQANAHTNGDVEASGKNHAGSAGEQADTGDKPYVHGHVGGGLLGTGTLTAGAHRKQGSAVVGALTGGAQGGAHAKGGPVGLGALTAANHGTAQVGQDTATAANSAFNTKAGVAAGVKAGTTTGTTAGAGTTAGTGGAGTTTGTTAGAGTTAGVRGRCGHGR